MDEERLGDSLKSKFNSILGFDFLVRIWKFGIGIDKSWNLGVC